MKGHILVVDDDARLRELLCDYLRAEGFEVTAAKSAEDARRKMAVFMFDAMVLDVMMPAETGFQLAASLASQHPPILFLTAMSDSADRITGLEHGAQDYLTKPFEPKELVLRLNNILRRVPSVPQKQETVLRFGEWSYWPQASILKNEEGEEYLTEVEHICLRALAQRPGETLSRDALAEAIAKETGSQPNARSVDVLITRLRKKIEPDSRRPRYIHTVRAKGYKLMAAES